MALRLSRGCYGVTPVPQISPQYGVRSEKRRKILKTREFQGFQEYGSVVRLGIGRAPQAARSPFITSIWQEITIRPPRLSAFIKAAPETTGDGQI